MKVRSCLTVPMHIQQVCLAAPHQHQFPQQPQGLQGFRISKLCQPAQHMGFPVVMGNAAQARARPTLVICPSPFGVAGGQALEEGVVHSLRTSLCTKSDGLATEVAGLGKRLATGMGTASDQIRAVLALGSSSSRSCQLALHEATAGMADRGELEVTSGPVFLSCPFFVPKKNSEELRFILVLSVLDWLVQTYKF